MTPDPYTQLAHHLHALGMGYPLKDDVVDILRANISPDEAKVILALPNTRIPLELSTADEVAANLGRPVKEVAGVLEELARRGMLFSGTSDDGQPGYALQQVGYGFPQSFFWKGERTPHAKDMAGRIVKYFRTPEIQETYGTTPKSYRYIPVNEAIKGPFQAVYPYEVAVSMPVGTSAPLLDGSWPVTILWPHTSCVPPTRRPALAVAIASRLVRWMCLSWAMSSQPWTRRCASAVSCALSPAPGMPFALSAEPTLHHQRPLVSCMGAF